MDKRRSTITFLMILLGSLAAAGAVHADAKDEARRHFDRAIGLVDDGQLEGALVEFQRSYDLTHHFAVLYNIGQVLVSLARPVEAFDAYQRYLADGREAVPAARRAEVEKEMARQKSRIALIEIYGLPDGARVHVDGKEMGKAPVAASFRVAVGKHAITVTAEGFEPAASEVTVAGEDHRMFSMALTRQATPAPVATAAPVVPVAPIAPVSPPMAMVSQTAPSPSPGMSKLRITGIVGVAVGVAALGAGAGFWLLASGRHNDAMKVYATDYPKAQSLQSQAQSYVTAANASLIAGGALVALGTVAFFVGRPGAPAAGPGPHASLAPVLGPGSAGLGVTGVW
jgi:hypothetical protein